MSFIINTENRKKWGTILIWVGVLAWVPFITLLSLDRDPSIFPFLTFHLIGVLGGYRLSGARDQEYSAAGRNRRTLSKILIYLGVMAWVPYIYLDKVAHVEVEITPFLIAHLTGIFSGAFVRISVYISEKKTS